MRHSRRGYFAAQQQPPKAKQSTKKTRPKCSTRQAIQRKQRTKKQRANHSDEKKSTAIVQPRGSLSFPASFRKKRW